MSTSFRPKQALTIDGDALVEFLGSATESVARQFLQTLVPFAEGSHIHDNGCGAGAVTATLFTLQPPNAGPRIVVDATDRDPAALQTLKHHVASEQWPVSIAEMDAARLDFADATFSHSFMNFVMLQVAEHDAQCAREIFRTLRPGGRGVITTWEDLPTMAIFVAAHREVRGPDARLPPMLQQSGYGGTQVRAAMIAAGFEESAMHIDQYAAQVRIRDPRRWCELGWSICGAAPDGWVADDEQIWEDVIQAALRALRSCRAYQNDDEHGGGWLRLTASAIVATKAAE